MNWSYQNLYRISIREKPYVYPHKTEESFATIVCWRADETGLWDRRFIKFVFSFWESARSIGNTFNGYCRYLRNMLLLHCKIQMLMETTSRIKPRQTRRAHWITRQILFNTQFKPASSAQHRFLIKFLFWPDSGSAASVFFVAFIARIIGVAAIEFYRNTVDYSMIMCTACFLVKDFPTNDLAFN